MIAENLKITGQWWFPNSDIRFNGELTFSSTEGGKLTILGPLESFVLLDNATETTTEKSNGESNTSQKLCKGNDTMSLILGKSNDGRKVTAVYTVLQIKDRLSDQIIHIVKENFILILYF